MPKPDHSQTPMPVEPSRHRLILERLQGGFYNQTEPSGRIATAVLAALHQLDKGPTLPH